MHSVFWNQSIDVELHFFETFPSWIHDSFMWVVHEIFHTMSKIKESGFCWVNFVSADTCGKALKIVASLSIDVHKSTNPVIEVSSMLVINFVSALLQYYFEQ